MPALPALFSPINFTSFSLIIDLSDEEKSVCVRRHQEHLDKTKAKRECYVYKPVKRLKKILRQLNRNLTSTNTETNCSLETKMHYSFDYAQQVHIPSNPMQPGPIYFKTPRKCGILGVTSEAVSQQIIILVDEGVSVGKGANPTISYLHYYLEHHGFGETDVLFHADKNRWGAEQKQFFLVVPCIESDLSSTQNNFIFISPKIGVVFVIPVETGEILDYEVKSLFSQV